jgi:two-component system, response regulator PdtaR
MVARVVIAEDEWVIAEQIRLELVKLGHEVVAIAGTGTAALDLCVKYHPDLILMDVRMPDMDGLEATSRIMTSCPTCVILVTGVPGLKDAAERAGAMGYVVKPVHARGFARLIEQAQAKLARLVAARESWEDDRLPTEEPAPARGSCPPRAPRPGPVRPD